MIKPNLLSVLLFGSFTLFGQAQTINKSSLTIEKIMQDQSKWIGTSPDNIKWSDDSKKIYFEWNPEKDTLASGYSYNTEKDIIQKVGTEEIKSTNESEYVYSDDYSEKLTAKNGKIFLKNLKSGNEKQIINLVGRVSQPRFLKNINSASFIYNQNLYLINFGTGTLSQLTNFVSGEKKKDKKSESQELWLAEQQLELFEILRFNEGKKKAAEKKQTLIKESEIEPVYIGTSRIRSISLSPNGKYIIYSLIENISGEKNADIMNFVTKTGYSETVSTRTKVGSKQPELSMFVLNIETQEVSTISASHLPGINYLPENQDNEKSFVKNSGNERKVNFNGPIWSNSKEIAIVVVRSHDNKDRWICTLDPAISKLELIDRQHDEAWIGGPGIDSSPYSSGKTGWFADDETIWFQSEDDSYSHLYTYNLVSGEKKQITKGNFEIYEPFISKDKKHFYFTANKVHPGVRHFYKMDINGKNIVQLTKLEGNNAVILSPDEKQLAIRYSSANEPWELYLQANSGSEISKRITKSTTEDFDSYKWRKPEFISYYASDGAMVYARLYRPEKHAQGGPAVLFVHGAGYLQNAHKWWSQYSKEYQFHNLLCDNGYTVLDIDYRGSAGYGRIWRTGIYRHMGGKDLSDHVAGAKLLIEKYNISPDKIGIYGGSYGGFITLMAMFNEPDVFKAGAALRSVTDWAHYNHGYTSNILNTPSIDSLAFKRSSPIYFAEGLKGALLMCHGMIDDNVHFQDIVRLSQKLIELGKENWELAVYPVESHSFTESSSWIDEYKRIYRLFENNLK